MLHNNILVDEMLQVYCQNMGDIWELVHEGYLTGIGARANAVKYPLRRCVADRSWQRRQKHSTRRRPGYTDTRKYREN